MIRCATRSPRLLLARGMLIHTSSGHKFRDCQRPVIDDAKTQFSSIQFCSEKELQMSKLPLRCRKH